MKSKTLLSNGESDTIKSTVTGRINTGQLTYTWYKDGEVIEGATDSYLVVSEKRVLS
ncbi:MAG: hypothetical protein R2771_15855 [Saprospiraceae bacterium]